LYWSDKYSDAGGLRDHCGQQPSYDDRAAARRPCTAAACLAANSRPSRRLLEVLQPFRSAFQCAELDGEDPRNLDDIRRYVAGRCARAPLARVLEDGSRSAGEIAVSLSGVGLSGGKFLYAVRVLNDVESGALQLDRLNDLPPGMDGFYLDAFERRFPENEDYAPAAALLGANSPAGVRRKPAASIIPEKVIITCTLALYPQRSAFSVRDTTVGQTGPSHPDNASAR
jgi:hypothetical protein